jgi:hypothetical protein
LNAGSGVLPGPVFVWAHGGWERLRINLRYIRRDREPMMGRELWVRAMLGGAAILGLGGVAGVGLANYTTDGSFEFYRQASMAHLHSVPDAAADSPWQMASLSHSERDIGADRDVGAESAFDR